MKKLKRNRVKCLACDTILESTDRHDYKTCDCPNNTMVDGGLAYERYGGVDMDKVETMFEYAEESEFLWGTLDIVSGRIAYKTFDEIDDDHLCNIALHLRVRYRHAATDFGRRRFSNDQLILVKNILPELERRGLEEVAEEIPWTKT